MGKTPCIFGCRGCLPMLVESLAFIATFVVAVLALTYPLISG